MSTAYTRGLLGFALALVASLAVPAGAQVVTLKIQPKSLNLRVGETQRVDVESAGMQLRIVTINLCDPGHPLGSKETIVTLGAGKPWVKPESSGIINYVTGKTPGKCSIIYRAEGRGRDPKAQDTLWITVTK
jgi:hypothetical protein